MKATGIIRKIDELGRIVIPKEIRKNLNIKDGEDLEILIEEDLIILKKYSKIKNMEEKVVEYMKIFSKYIKGEIILTDREKVIYSIDETFTNKKLSNKLVKTLEERKKVSSYEEEFLEISSDYKKNTKYVIYPIIINTDLFGGILLLTTNNMDENLVLIFNILCTIIKYELEN